jgi:Kdo2-lipid IVA lauroyltransferase/acyltransferase
MMQALPRVAAHDALSTAAPQLPPAVHRAWLLVRWLAGRSHRSKWWMARAMARAQLLLHARVAAQVQQRLALAYPGLDVRQQQRLAYDNLCETAYALLDRFRLWRLCEKELRDQIDLHGADVLHRYLGKQPVVLLCPHFAGLEAAGQRLILEGPGMTLYNPQPDPHFDAVCRHGRQRFGVQLLLPVGASLLPLARRLQRGVALLLLPDLPHAEPAAPSQHLFDPDAGTAPIAAWCAARLGAVLLPVTVLRCAGRYSVTVHEPLPLPMSDHAADMAATTQAICAALEGLVRLAPQQYLWAQLRPSRPAAAAPLGAA